MHRMRKNEPQQQQQQQQQEQTEQQQPQQEQQQSRETRLHAALDTLFEVGGEVPMIGVAIKILGSFYKLFRRLNKTVGDAKKILECETYLLSTASLLVHNRQFFVDKEDEGARILATRLDVAVKALNALSDAAEDIVGADHSHTFHGRLQQEYQALFSDFDELKVNVDAALEEFKFALAIDISRETHGTFLAAQLLLKDAPSEVLRKAADLIFKKKHAEAIDVIDQHAATYYEHFEVVRDPGSSMTALEVIKSGVTREYNYKLLGMKAAALWGLKKWREALDDYIKVLKIAPKNSSAWYGIGCILSEPLNTKIKLISLSLRVHHGNVGAKEAYQKAVELDPSLKEKLDPLMQGMRSSRMALHHPSRSSSSSSSSKVPWNNSTK